MEILTVLIMVVVVGFFVNNYPCVFAGIAMGRNMTFAIKAVKVAFGE